MQQLIDNANPKKNPVTSFFGGIFLSVSVTMFCVKYIVPVFVVTKAEVPYEWYVPVVPLIIGLALIFMNESYWERIFNRTEKIIEKKTDTN